MAVNQKAVKKAIKTMEKVIRLGIDYNPRYIMQHLHNNTKYATTLREAKENNIGLCFAGCISLSKAFKKAGGTIVHDRYPVFNMQEGGDSSMQQYFGFNRIMDLIYLNSEYKTPYHVIEFLKTYLDEPKAE